MSPRAWSQRATVGMLRINLAIVGVTALFLSPAAISRADGVDRSSPPIADASAGGFTARRLPGLVPIDGREWISVRTIGPGEAAASRSGGYSVSLRQPTDEGDLERAHPLFERPGEPAVSLAPGVVAYAYVTVDGKWIFVEPLDVIDVSTWRRYSLSGRLGIEPYIAMRAISADGRRLIVSRRDCAFDCQTIQDEYYEIVIPESGE